MFYNFLYVKIKTMIVVSSRIIFFIFTIATFVFFLFGCAAKTYYVRDESNGFTDQRIGESVYQVKVKSRNVKDKKHLQDMFYFRAAELTKENGFRYFFTVEKVDDLSGMNGKARPFKQRILTAIVYENITIEGLVKFLSEKEELAVNVYDAEAVYRQKYYLIEERNNVFGDITSTNATLTTLSPTNQEFNIKEKSQKVNQDNVVEDNKSTNVNRQEQIEKSISDSLEFNLFDTE